MNKIPIFFLTYFVLWVAYFRILVHLEKHFDITFKGFKWTYIQATIKQVYQALNRTSDTKARVYLKVAFALNLILTVSVWGFLIVFLTYAVTVLVLAS